MLFAALALALAIQDPAPQAPVSQDPPAAEVKKETAPELSKEEHLEGENIALRFMLLEEKLNNTDDGKKLQEVQKEFKAFADGLNKEHPGWVYNSKTAKFEKPAVQPTHPTPATKQPVTTPQN